MTECFLRYLEYKAYWGFAPVDYAQWLRTWRMHERIVEEADRALGG